MAGKFNMPDSIFASSCSSEMLLFCTSTQSLSFALQPAVKKHKHIPFMVRPAAKVRSVSKSICDRILNLKRKLLEKPVSSDLFTLFQGFV